MFKIIITVIIIIVLLIILNYFNLFNTNQIDNFKSIGSSGGSGSGSNSSSSSSSSSRGFSLNGSKNLGLGNVGTNPQLKNQIDKVDSKVLFSNKDYNENLSIDNKDNQYFYTDMINQSNINETAFNIIYSIDPIDYSDVETGLDKCNKECKGVCFENGYDGIATCYPMQSQSFDWGTLYKNPTFTYGYNAYSGENLPQ
jgi:hypothetical protein